MNKFIISLCFILSMSVKANTAPVVLLSIDGFSAAYLEQFKPKNLLSIQAQGLSSLGLTPVFPSKTFPNHLTMVTGEYPNQHGIIHNKFYNRVKKKKYHLGAGRHDPSWLKAEPIWITAEKNNIISASYFWPESEATIKGIKPTYRYAYDESITNQERLSEIVRWLQMPEEKKPLFILSYFSLVDNAGHHFGSTSVQVEQAVMEIDRLIGQFLTQLKQLNININLLIVSDHGMLNIEQDNAIELETLPLSSTLDLVHNGETQLYIYEQESNLIHDTVNSLNAVSKNRYKAYINGQFPEHWHFNQLNDVMPDIIVNAVPPYFFSYGKGTANKGIHGYDPVLSKQMNGIFISQGPNIKPGYVDEFSNIYLHSFLSTLLHLPQTALTKSSPLQGYTK